MNPPLFPTTSEELVEAVRAAPRIIPVGAGTKPRLSEVEATRVSTTRLSGIIEYEPSEFTFTALAGTPLRDVVKTLAECGQYLPFDPMLTRAGATIGGTVAAGISGPGRFRFGGLRDFILAVRFVDGAGRLLRMGGKVVKNAAGFDLPKFFVGSLGRFGMLSEVTFKVFPLQKSRLTLLLEAATPEAALQILNQAGSARWEVDALDWLPGQPRIALRILGPTEALDSLAEEILTRWPGEKLTTAAADELWTSLAEFEWAETSDSAAPLLLKIPTNLDVAAQVRHHLEALGGRVHISSGGNVSYAAFVPGTDSAAVDAQLKSLNLSSLSLSGPFPLWLGTHQDRKISANVKAALDAENRFPNLHD